MQPKYFSHFSLEGNNCQWGLRSDFSSCHNYYFVHVFTSSMTGWHGEQWDFQNNELKRQWNIPITGS
jgi:hypothetical protein